VGVTLLDVDAHCALSLSVACHAPGTLLNRCRLPKTKEKLGLPRNFSPRGRRRIAVMTSVRVCLYMYIRHSHMCVCVCVCAFPDFSKYTSTTRTSRCTAPSRYAARFGPNRNAIRSRPQSGGRCAPGTSWPCAAERAGLDQPTQFANRSARGSKLHQVL